MPTDQPLWQALQRANPLPCGEHPLDDPEEMAMRYDTLTSKRDRLDPGGMQVPRATRPRRRAWLAAAFGFVVVLVAVGIATFAAGGFRSEVAPADGIESTVATSTPSTPTTDALDSAPPTTGVPPPDSEEGPRGFSGQYFTGQQRWVEPAVFLDSNGRPAVFLGLGPPFASPPLAESAIADCGDDDCTTVAVHGFPALVDKSTQYLLADGSASNIWSAAVRDDGAPVFAVVAVDDVDRTGSGSLDTTITLLTCDSYLCLTATETEIVRVSSDAARLPGTGLPVPADVALALGSESQPIVAFTGWYGTVTEINDSGVWREDSGSGVAVAVCSDADCTDGAVTTVVESLESGEGAIATYGSPTLAPGAGDRPILMYGRVTSPSEATGETRIAACQDPWCAAIEVTTVETWLNTNTGGPVMTLGTEELPVIAHWRWWEERQPTVLTMCRVASCADVSTVSLPGFGDRVDLSISADGFPVLTFLADDKATVLTCEDVMCSDYVLGTPLGQLLYQGTPTVVAASDGPPYLAYFDALADRALHVGRCVDAMCTSVLGGGDPAGRRVPVPDLQGFYDGDTAAWAESAGLVLVIVGDVPTDPSQAVEILRQEPAPGSLVPVGSDVTIWLASG